MVMPIKDMKLDGAVGGRRPTAVPAPSAAAYELGMWSSQSAPRSY